MTPKSPAVVLPAAGAAPLDSGAVRERVVGSLTGLGEPTTCDHDWRERPDNGLTYCRKCRKPKMPARRRYRPGSWSDYPHGPNGPYSGT